MIRKKKHIPEFLKNVRIPAAQLQELRKSAFNDQKRLRPEQSETCPTARYE